MNAACACFQSWLDADEAGPPSAAEGAARAEHLAGCAGCRGHMQVVETQRALVRALHLAQDPEQAPLSDTLVARYVGAMRRAARIQRDRLGDESPPR